MKIITNKKGFTLVEILVAALIMIILITMAVPMYERAIEKSRKAEVSTVLKRIAEAKLRLMDQHGTSSFWVGSKDAAWPQLDIEIPSSADFTYSLYPNDTFRNSVCAKRAKGDYAGTIFLYVNEEECACKTVSSSDNTSICGQYCNKSEKLFCSGTHCEDYGMENQSGVGACGS